MSGPIPPETNPPVNPQYFQPSNFVISTITRGLTTTVTTSSVNNFVVGQQVRFNISPGYGMRQINGQAPIISTINSTTQFVVPIDSRKYDPYVSSPGLPYSYQTSQVNAIGDANYAALAAQTSPAIPATISGAFQNISPN